MSTTPFPVPPSPLSFPDYDQLISDHRRCLILIKTLGPGTGTGTGTGVHGDALKRIGEHLLQSVTRFQLEDEALSPTPIRSIEVRFVKSYPVENNEWNEFQLHRGILGLVSLCGFRDHLERAEVFRLHETIKVSPLCYNLDQRHDFFDLFKFSFLD